MSHHYASKILQCQYHFHTKKDYPILFNEDYVLKIDIGSTVISLYLNLKKNSSKAIICGPSAIDAQKVTAPFFHRWSWAHRFSYSTIVISDPTLETGKFNIGWFLGTENEHFLVKCANIINKLLSQLEILSKDVIFYGSSAGGFSSMMMAAYLKGSKVITQNPQIDVKLYHGDFYSSLLKQNFPNHPPSDDKLSIISFYKKVGYVPDIYYIQNIYDSHHYDTHLSTFLSGLAYLKNSISNSPRLNLEIYADKLKGHNADNFEDATPRLNRAFQFFYSEDFSYI